MCCSVHYSLFFLYAAHSESVGDISNEQVTFPKGLQVSRLLNCGVLKPHLILGTAVVMLIGGSIVRQPTVK